MSNPDGAPLLATVAILAMPDVTASVLFGLSDMFVGVGRDWPWVIEGRPGDEGQMQVFSRFIEFPDGTRLKLPKRPGPQKSAPAGRRARIKRARQH